MKLTILEVGDVPADLQAEFKSYPLMFIDMFAAVDADFEYETIQISHGEPLPDIADVQAVLLPGAVAGVYDALDWMEPLREFIRRAYARNIPMVGVCFGHQIIADALGGDVRKSEKGWGIGRHVYDVVKPLEFVDDIGPQIAIAASHQDQVITPPAEAEVFLSTDFTPNAGLIYENAVTMSVQPHPEFNRDYIAALIEARRGTKLTQDVADKAIASLDKPLEGAKFAKAITRFFEAAV